MTSDFLFPFKPGDWVMNQSGRVAKVKAVDEWKGEVTFDLILYSRTGEKVGRESPAMGGPRTFEPSCSIEGWERCEEPSFPLELKWVSQADGSSRAEYWVNRLPPANYRKPKRRYRGRVFINQDYENALRQIANGHNDPSRLAKEALRGKL